MKTIQSLIFLLGAFSFHLSFSQETTLPVDTPAPPEGYFLAWADEFHEDGKPNEDFWSYEQGFTRNEELQWYQEDNANVKNGFLLLKEEEKK